MSSTVSIHYFEPLDHWSWEVTVNNHSVYGYEYSYKQALEAVRDVLEDMLREVDE